MAQRNQHDDDRRHDMRHQQDQYASGGQPYAGQHDSSRDERQHGSPYGSHDAQRYGSRDDLSRNDPTQASYGRFGAPDVHHQPSGGYSSYGHQDQQRYGADPGRQARQGSQGYGGYGTQDFDSGNRSQQRRPGFDQDGRQAGYRGQDDQQDRGRFQGGAGGYQSNTGAYAGAQNYGGTSDQLGYGSNERGHQGGNHPGHWDPEYQQWRDEQMRSLDADYHSWRGERYRKFSDEFGEWRKNRQVGDAPRDGADAASGKADAGTSATGSGAGNGNPGASGAK